MATEYEKIVKEAQDRVISGLKELDAAQEQALAAAKEAQTAVMEQFPPVQTLVENAYAFAGQVFDIQKKSALRWLEFWTPNGNGKPAGAAKQ